MNLYRNDAYKYIGWHRRIRTTQERRACFDENGRPTLGRTKRNLRNLPSGWDDINVNRLKSWKKHRKVQYHTIDYEA